MRPEQGSKAEFVFSKAKISGIVTTVGGNTVQFADEGIKFGLTSAEISRLQRAIGLDRRQIVLPGQTTVDLCKDAAKRLLAGLTKDAASIPALILVTQSPDYAAPSSAITLQHELGLPTHSMAFDMRLGCSGFVYGLSVAFSLIESGLSSVLLCVGDVASQMVDSNDHAIAPIMGDAGAAILIEAGATRPSYFQLNSDGSGARALMIPNSGQRHLAEDEGKPALMTMDGAAVFNFTLQRVPALVNDMLAFSGCEVAEIDNFVLHQPNKYILKNIQKRLNIPDEKMPTGTQSLYGNQNSASIPGTISAFLSEKFSSGRCRSLFAGFGIGLSWGACVVDTENIYAPSPFTYTSIDA